ncbi:hypothetical protein BU17DRAFT_68385 [Hysterangium stoloniferum]|nr:hypothetical protein BU17DRAFT_68385 [Hysterangium stoloniferum]
MAMLTEHSMVHMYAIKYFTNKNEHIFGIYQCALNTKCVECAILERPGRRGVSLLNTKYIECAILERPGRRGVSSSSLTTSAVVWRVGTFAKGSAMTTGGDVATRHSGEARKAMRELVVTDDERSSMTRRNVAEGQRRDDGRSTVLSVEEAQRNKGAN